MSGNWEEIRATLDRIARLNEESRAADERRQAEYERRQAEYQAAHEKRQAEARAADEKWRAESQASMKKLEKQVQATNEMINGIGKSNGMVAEEYFYDSLNETKTFGGVHYDDVETNWRRTVKLPDKTRLQGQYDIVMLNDESVCLIETKYRVRPGDAQDLADRQVVNFKLLFPMYAGYKYYLGIGGMCFDEKEKVEAEAKRLGIGVLRLNGDAVEISDENLKAY